MRNNYLLSLLRTPRRAIATALATGLAVSALSGCAIQQLAGSNEPQHRLLRARRQSHGRNTPIGGATVTLYASAVNTSISSGTYVGTATVLGTTTTASGSGAFTFGTVASCATNSLVYVTISGGKHRRRCECQHASRSVLGVCGTLSSFTVVNEASTIAMAYALSSFTSIDGSGNINITAPVANSSVAATKRRKLWHGVHGIGSLHAYNNFLNLVNVPNGWHWLLRSQTARPSHRRPSSTRWQAFCRPA